MNMQLKHKSPTFKEVARLITATQRLVEGLDSVFLRQLNLRRYLEDALRLHFTEDDSASPRWLQSLWSKDSEKRSKSLRVLSESFGIIIADETILGNSAPIDLYEEYGHMSYKEAFELFIQK